MVSGKSVLIGSKQPAGGGQKFDPGQSNEIEILDNNIFGQGKAHTTTQSGACFIMQNTCDVGVIKIFLLSTQNDGVSFFLA